MLAPSGQPSPKLPVWPGVGVEYVWTAVGVGVCVGVELLVAEPWVGCGAAKLPHPDSVAATKTTARPIAAVRSGNDRETIRADGTLAIASTIIARASAA
jgi:hypothetical protein